jgi:hypothetical protein
MCCGPQISRPLPTARAARVTPVSESERNESNAVLKRFY